MNGNLLIARNSVKKTRAIKMLRSVSVYSVKILAISKCEVRIRVINIRGLCEDVCVVKRHVREQSLLDKKKKAKTLNFFRSFIRIFIFIPLVDLCHVLKRCIGNRISWETTYLEWKEKEERKATAVRMILFFDLSQFTLVISRTVLSSDYDLREYIFFLSRDNLHQYTSSKFIPRSFLFSSLFFSIFFL